MSVDVSVHNSA